MIKTKCRAVPKQSGIFDFSDLLDYGCFFAVVCAS
jgi:hypothetical protein